MVANKFWEKCWLFKRSYGQLNLTGTPWNVAWGSIKYTHIPKEVSFTLKKWKDLDGGSFFDIMKEFCLKDGALVIIFLSSTFLQHFQGFFEILFLPVIILWTSICKIAFFFKFFFFNRTSRLEFKNLTWPHPRNYVKICFSVYKFQRRI